MKHDITRKIEKIRVAIRSGWADEKIRKVFQVPMSLIKKLRVELEEI